MNFCKYIKYTLIIQNRFIMYYCLKDDDKLQKHENLNDVIDKIKEEFPEDISKWIIKYKNKICLHPYCKNLIKNTGDNVYICFCNYHEQYETNHACIICKGKYRNYYFYISEKFVYNSFVCAECLTTKCEVCDFTKILYCENGNSKKICLCTFFLYDIISCDNSFCQSNDFINYNEYQEHLEEHKNNGDDEENESDLKRLKSIYNLKILNFVLDNNE